MFSLEIVILFPKIPVELRIKIWQEAMPPYRLVMMDEFPLLANDFRHHGDATYRDDASACWENEGEELQYLETDIAKPWMTNTPDQRRRT